MLLAPKLSWAEHHHEADALQISLLTCGPGADPYELYGHTALRVQNELTGEDLVFNYGIFDFDTPNFGLRFMLGQTDFKMGVTHFYHFAHSYQRDGRSIVEQVLNLQPDEKIKMLAALDSLWRMEDWTYRYNILYDNCSTRAIDQIKTALNGQMVLSETENGKHTFRSVLHEFSSETSPWYAFGEDLILGSEIDHPLEVSKLLFSPVYAEKYMDSAYVLEADGARRPLVSRKVTLLEAAQKDKDLFPISPMTATMLLLVATLGWCAWEFSRKRLNPWIDYILMFGTGLAGLIVGFLFFLSEHPAVGSNWLVLLFNPLPLIYLPFKIRRDRLGKKDYYYRFVGVAIGIIVVTALLGLQKYPAEYHFLALILLLRLNMTLFLEKKKNIDTKTASGSKG